MSLHDVLLSLLREPMSGTDLIELFNSSIHHFWKTDLSQIYRALEALEKEGCLNSKSMPSPRGPARRVYALTGRGRRRLREWVRREPTVPPVKFEYLAQLFSVTADERPRERALELLRAIRAESATAVAVLEGIDAAMSELPGYPDDLPSHLFYPWLTLRHGLHRRRALLQWIDDSIERLERRTEDADKTAGQEAIAELSRLLREIGDPAATVQISEEV
jgi:DNA-binding PadR family transcriptional regulator